MADNKQYITQTQENGKVMISETVISSIVAQSVSEVEGVVSLCTRSGEAVSKKNMNKGMKIVIAQDDTLCVDCNVIVEYGQSVVVVAKAVQDAITGAIESMTGIQVSNVNVNVCGVIRN